MPPRTLQAELAAGSGRAPVRWWTHSRPRGLALLNHQLRGFDDRLTTRSSLCGWQNCSAKWSSRDSLDAS